MPVQVLNRAVRDTVYRLTLAAVKREVARTGDPDDPAQLAGHCLEFAYQGYQILKAWPGASRTIIQAGSAQWPRVPPELDDGVSPTHFAYEWEVRSRLACLVRRGIIPFVCRADGHVAPSLPEMHVWLGCPDSGELIDFSTGLWPAACEATLCRDWPAPLPPDYFWGFGKSLPAGVSYVPDRDAIETVIAVLRQQGRQYP